LLVGLLVVLLWSLWRSRRSAAIDRRQSVALLGGLATAPFLMLIAISMSFRYRMEFYPLLELGALLGAFLLLCAPPKASPRRTTMLWTAAIIGIAACHFLLLLYKLSPFGPATHLVGRAGVVAYYRSVATTHLAP
jgi:hypothetical protein